jgi:hypothetical protein
MESKASFPIKALRLMRLNQSFGFRRMTQKSLKMKKQIKMKKQSRCRASHQHQNSSRMLWTRASRWNNWQEQKKLWPQIIILPLEISDFLCQWSRSWFRESWLERHGKGLCPLLEFLLRELWETLLPRRLTRRGDRVAGQPRRLGWHERRRGQVRQGRILFQKISKI